MIRLANLLIAERVVMLEETEKLAALTHLVHVLAASALVRNESELLESIRGRELIMSTGIGFGIAVPHAKISSVDDVTMAVGISSAGIPFESLDEKPVHIIVMIAAGANQQDKYIRTLARVMLVLKTPATRQELIAAHSPAAVLEIFKRF